MSRARKHKSAVVARIKELQDPLVAARNKKRLIVAAKIADAIEGLDISKGEFAERLGKYSSEVTRWTSGFHNFTLDTISDIEEVLGIQILSPYKPHKPNATIIWKLQVDVTGEKPGVVNRKEFEKAENYIAECGGLSPTTYQIESKK